MCTENSFLRPGRRTDFAGLRQIGHDRGSTAWHSPDDDTVYKIGPGVRLSEAATMEYVRRRTTIPVPEVLAFYRDAASGHFCIQMRRLAGDRLEDAYGALAPAAKLDLAAQLDDYVRQLRGLGAGLDRARIGTVDGKPVGDRFFAADRCGGHRRLHGSETEFLDSIAEVVDGCGAYSAATTGVVGLIRSLPRRSRKRKFVMTHGELQPRNILVRGSKVTAILDWSQAGTYPDYWEYVKSYFCWDDEHEWMRDGFPDLMISFQVHPQQLDALQQAKRIIW